MAVLVLESQRLSYIVVARLHCKLQSLLRKETAWQKSGIEGTEVAEIIYRGSTGAGSAGSC